MRVHQLTFAALAVVAGLSLTACNDGDDSGKGDSSSGSSASSSAGGSGSSGSDQGGGKDSAGQESTGKNSAGKSSGGQGATSGAGSGASGKTGKCRTDALNITASDSTIDGDSDASVAVTMENGGRDCTMAGFAGVDLKTSEGNLSAERTGQPADQMVLKAGKSVSFGINYPMNDSGGSGVTVTGLVVTPPGETKSFSIEWPGKGTLPVTDGSGAPVTVGPIGSAGQGG
ncbi:DUF4232 domain-containing protein [Streptomyces sp. AN091965]|uniref:DUF4232 domain-containing protein n=1 Tax=Streptomyces sp. AN091965 TaxID=2927803 RepID=UPI001F61DFD2|nr:DUF4232 domain-containing protein [Streptomyces sp. AN091965]MCI3928581.1 DUF4232 domain-containing protein [Streptomyces sp. AN091965]